MGGLETRDSSDTWRSGAGSLIDNRQVAYDINAINWFGHLMNYLMETRFGCRPVRPGVGGTDLDIDTIVFIFPTIWYFQSSISRTVSTGIASNFVSDSWAAETAPVLISRPGALRRAELRR